MRQRFLRKAVIRFIALLPLVGLLFLITPFLNNLWRINHPSMTEIGNSLEAALQGRLIPDPDLEIKKLLQSEKRAKKLVYFFGGSSLVVMWEKSAKPHRFPEYFDQWSENIEVLNYGSAGFDSFDILSRLHKKINVRRPDQVVIYTGHNDYTRGYREIRPHFALLKGTVFKSLFKLLYQERFIDDRRIDAVLDFEYEPLVLNFLSKFGLFHTARSRFPKFDQIIEKYLEINMRKISQVLHNQNIPLVLLSAVGNLHIPPVGSSNLLSDHRKALEIDQYSKRIHALNEIRDNDFHSPDIRARSKVKEIFSSIAEDFPFTEYLDLEKYLLKRKFQFSYDEFTDYFYFNEKGHRAIASVLKEVIPD